MNEPEAATQKAKELVRMGLAKARFIEPLERVHLPMTQKALVIGGGLSGMVAAKNLAEQGFEVYLIERESELGGNLRHIHYTLEGLDVKGYLDSLIKEIEGSDLIHPYLSTRIESIEGFVGNYKTTLLTPPPSQVTNIEHGVIVVATGGVEYKPKEYLYGEDSRVITQRELEEKLARGKEAHPSTVVMIQCVGSRDKDRPYCSRYCCGEAVKNALKIKELSSKTEVFILYRDIRTYGFMEEYYKKAREAGVIFIRYDEENRPDVRLNSKSDQLEVEIFDPILQEKLILNPDLVVLSAAIIPQTDSKDLAKMLKVPLNADGFFLEAHVKLRPVEFATDGVFLAGLAHSPKNIPESIAQAHAAASRATVLLSQEYIEAEGQISRVDINRCSACGLCVDLCAYKAIEIKVVDERRGIEAAQINEALCKGCGACAANCRCGAIDVMGFTAQQLYESVCAV
jgi:heterodisulfide reductase subunit A